MPARSNAHPAAHNHNGPAGALAPATAQALTGLGVLTVYCTGRGRGTPPLYTAVLRVDSDELRGLGPTLAAALAGLEAQLTAGPVVCG